MKVVVGLCNPGSDYQGTRHNVGLLALEELLRRQDSSGTGFSRSSSRFEAQIAEIRIGTETVRLVAPQTYMNLSGRSVRKVVDFYHLSADDLLVVCDDLNLDTGRLRLRASGSGGGQKGLHDIINRLGTVEFCRLRIGIGRPPGRMNAADYVLRKFRKNEQELIDQAVVLAADAVELWVRDGIEATMNRYNGPQSS